MRGLNSLTFTKKLVAGFGIIVFLLLGLAAFSVVKVLTIGDALTAQKVVAEQKLAPLYVAREALNQTGIAARNAYIVKDESHAKRELDILRAQAEHLSWRKALNCSRGDQGHRWSANELGDKRIEWPIV